MRDAGAAPQRLSRCAHHRRALTVEAGPGGLARALFAMRDGEARDEARGQRPVAASAVPEYPRTPYRRGRHVRPCRIPSATGIVARVGAAIKRTGVLRWHATRFSRFSVRRFNARKITAQPATAQLSASLSP